MLTQMNYSYPEEFKNLIKKIQNKNRNVDLCELDGIGRQLDVNAFSRKFFSKSTSTTADVSVDANANIEEVTVIQYISEIAKPVHRMNSYFMLWKYAKELYSTEFAEKAVTAQLMKDIYINDFHTYGVGIAYCFNFSCMDVICMGLPYVKKVSSMPPKHLSSYMGQMVQFITYAGNSLAGASAVGDILIGAAYFVEKLRKENKSVPKEFLDKQIKQEIQSFIYSVNQPFRGGVQCVDEDTEVLTPNGFKKYNELKFGDDIYTWKQGKLEIQKVDRVNISNYKGEMHRYLGRDCEMNLSPNHRVLHIKNKSSEYDMHLSSELIDLKTPLNIPVACEQFDREDYGITDEVLLYNTINKKEQLPGWVFELSKRQAKLVIDEWKKDDIGIQCNSETLADQLQHICFLAGYNSSIIKNDDGIHLIIDENTSRIYDKSEKYDYDGIIWCPTTKNGVVVFRKNGKLFISGNSTFTNVSIYDNVFLKKLCSEYIFPDGKTVSPETVKEVQEIYIDLMNETLNTSPVTFPVTTACFATDDNNKIMDEEFLDFIVKKNLKYAFMNIYAGKTSTLSSCCRLRNDASNSEYFNSFGAGGSKIGSLGVVTLNLPRLAVLSKGREDFLEKVQEYTELAAKINNVKRYILKKRIDGGHYPLYSLGFMNLKKQYSTTGLIGINEACEILGYNIMEKEGQQFVLDTLDIINKVNSIQEKKYKSPHNVEQIPGESVATKLAEADKLLGYNKKKYELYSNQFIPLVSKADFLDRIKLQGIFDKHMTGGAIAHLNFSDPITDKEFMKNLIRVAVENGVIYHAVNYNLQQCEDKHITAGKNKSCPVCGKEITDNFTRVVGFLVNVKNFNKVRREKDYPNRQWYEEKKELLEAVKN